MRPKITAWTIVGIILIISAAVFAVSWFYLGWKGIPGGIWVLAGMVIVGVFSVLNDIFGLLVKITRMGRTNLASISKAV